VLRRQRARRALASICLSLVFFMLPQGVAAVANEEAGTFGAAFLRIPVGAKAMTLPGVVAGMRPDASMIFSNPAVLAEISAGEVYLSRANWLDDLSLNAIGLVVPAPLDLKWSFGSRLLYSGGLKGYDAAGQVVSEDSYYDLDFSTALSRRFTGIGLGVGVGVTYLREHLPQENGRGVVFSLGTSYQRSGHRVELVAEDIGGALSFPSRDYPIDSRYGIGYGRSFRPAWGVFDVGTQMSFSRSKAKRFRIGAAYLANPFLTLRTGFEHVFSAPETSQMPVSAGFGFHFGALTLDYAYTSQEYFSSTHTVSFLYSFGLSPGGDAMRPNTRRRSEGRKPPVAQPVTTAKATAKAQPRPTDQEKPVAKPADPKPAQDAAAGKNKPEKGASGGFAVIAGVHSRMESAQAEVRALRLLKIPAVVDKSGGHLRVLIAKYGSRKKAEKALAKFRKKGHVFRVVAEER